MKMFKTTFWSGIETVIKLLSGLLVIKLIAKKFGPEGMAIFGQFQSFSTFVIFVCSGVFINGLVKYSAEVKNNSKRSKEACKGAFGFGIILNLLMMIILFVFASNLSLMIFNTNSYTWIIRIFSFSIFFISFYQILIAVLNGRGELYKLISAKISSSFVLLILTILLMYKMGLEGGLLSLTLIQAVAFIFALFFFFKQKGITYSWIIPSFSRRVNKELFPYFLTSIISAIAAPVVLMAIRKHIMSQFGLSVAGHWEAIWKIAELYILVFTTALVTYYLPVLSASKTAKEKRKIVNNVLVFSVAISTIAMVVLYISRKFFILLLFSEEFLVIEKWILLQLIGSVIKVAAWVLAYFMIAHKKLIVFALSEIFFGGLFYFLSIKMINYFGWNGVIYSFVTSYLLYLIFCGWYYLHLLKNMEKLELSMVDG